MIFWPLAFIAVPIQLVLYKESVVCTEYFQAVSPNVRCGSKSYMCIRMSRVLIFKSSASSCGDNQASQVELVQISADIQQFPPLNQLKDSNCEKFDFQDVLYSKR